ncbi:MAG: histone deacetylase family protein [Candidatus Hodarchaeota archaeon]
MIFIYSKRFEKGEYSNDPASDEERFYSVARMIKDQENIVEARPATKEEILEAHTEQHYRWVKQDKYLFEMASLAAGGAIQTAELGYEGKPAFAAIRPPGHHASGGSCWGFCFFNNMSVAILNLMRDKKIESAFILDFDLHTGDGNINILSSYEDISIINPDGPTRKSYLNEIKDRFSSEKNYDILGVSAGFDQYEHDWGRLLTREDFTRIGELAAEFSDKKCKGRRFALLEGGYNFEELGKNILAFCNGFE